MDMADVIRRLAEAARVLGRLPEGSRYEHPFLTSWPDYKFDPNTVHGYGYVKAKPPIPSPAALQPMEENPVRLQLAPMEFRRLLWFRAEGESWCMLGRYFSCDSRQVRPRWRDGIVLVFGRVCDAIFVASNSAKFDEISHS